MIVLVDQLSDTIYREKAIEIVDRFIAEYGDHGTPVDRSQIYGLRQIAVQQPGVIKSFADHQRERVEKKLETAGQRSRPKLEAQQGLWKLIADLCETNKLPWSPATEAESQMPVELQERNIVAKADCKSNEDRSRRKQLLKQQKEWLQHWNAQHVPAFFQRFCTHYLYQLGKREGQHQ